MTTTGFEFEWYFTYMNWENENTCVCVVDKEWFPAREKAAALAGVSKEQLILQHKRKYVRN